MLLFFAPALRVVIYNSRLTSELIEAQRPFNSGDWKQWSLSDEPDLLAQPSLRQKMIRDLVSTRLPGMNKEAIEEILGVSVTHEDMTRSPTAEEMPVVGAMGLDTKGHFYDEHGWDLLEILSIVVD